MLTPGRKLLTLHAQRYSLGRVSGAVTGSQGPSGGGPGEGCGPQRPSAALGPGQAAAHSERRGLTGTPSPALIGADSALEGSAGNGGRGVVFASP